jgi:RNA polymerase sigma-70 factor (ECF subfamily)
LGRARSPGHVMSSTVHNIAAKKLPLEEQAPSVDDSLSFRVVYDTRFHDVVRWVRAMGGRDEDLDDLAQEVFIIVRRKLPSFDGQNLQGWLYRITQRTVRDYRRAAWFRNLLTRKKLVDHEGVLLRLVEPGRDPAQQQELREAQQTLRLILDRMREKHRTAFVLFELEGYTGEEIAALESTPVSTVFTRLYHARKEFAAIIEQLRQERRLG